MANRLPSWVFLVLGLFLMGYGMTPIIRVLLGLDDQFIGSYIWSVTFLVGGVMLGLTAMLLMVRRQPMLITYHGTDTDIKTAVKIHAAGLLILTGIPLLNFLVCYWLWMKHRHQSAYLDFQGREVLCFQITIYLYMLMCLFMAYIILGFVALPFLLLFHALATLWAIYQTLQGQWFFYPANIAIIERWSGEDVKQEE